MAKRPPTPPRREGEGKDPDRFIWKERDVKIIHDPYANDERVQKELARRRRERSRTENVRFKRREK